MADSAQEPSTDREQAAQEMPPVVGASPAGAPPARGDDVFAERPELLVGAAFAGGIVLAQVLKRLRR